MSPLNPFPIPLFYFQATLESTKKRRTGGRGRLPFWLGWRVGPLPAERVGANILRGGVSDISVISRPQAPSWVAAAASFRRRGPFSWCSPQSRRRCGESLDQGRSTTSFARSSPLLNHYAARTERGFSQSKRNQRRWRAAV